MAQQCVPFARDISGISLRGDAWTWWASAEGSYKRGSRPETGAVLVFKKHGSMRHGHVSVVSRVVGEREVLVDHSNWAPVRASDRGKIGRNVRVLDISPRNDWTQVRVWHEPSAEFGVRVYPVYGFIYGPPDKSRGVQSADAKASADGSAVALADAGPLEDRITPMGKTPRMAKPSQAASLITAQSAEVTASESAVTASAFQAEPEAAPAAVEPVPETPAPPQTTAAAEHDTVWAGDREAAARAGSGRY